MIRRLLSYLQVRVILAALFVLGLYYGLSLWAGKAQRWYFTALFDFVVAFVVLLILLFLAAQFVLPVRTWDERRTAFRHLYYYLTGSHGPVVFIKNGRLVAKPRELQKRGPGVILLDSASAAVLRTAAAYTRVVGPGIAFTGGAENLLEDDIVDLRIQSRTLRGDAFDSENRPRSEADRTARATHGVTRDGIEIVPDIQVVFQLVNHRNYDNVDPDPGARTRLGFHRNSVWRAVVRQPIDSNEQQQQIIIPWTDLPAKLAADLWREYIRQITLDDLFSFPLGHRSTIEMIVDRLNMLLAEDPSPLLLNHADVLFQGGVAYNFQASRSPMLKINWDLIESHKTQGAIDELTALVSSHFPLIAPPSHPPNLETFWEQLLDRLARLGQTDLIERVREYLREKGLLDLDQDQLPGSKILMERFRAQIRQETLSDLEDRARQLFPDDVVFAATQDQPSALEIIIKRIEERMTQEETTILGIRTRHLFKDRPGINREYRILMERGIRVLGVRIENLRFSKTVRQGLIARWKENWVEVAEKEKERLDRLEATNKLQGERLGMKLYQERSSPSLRHQLMPGRGLPSRPEAVCLVVEDLLELIRKNPDLQSELEGEDLDLLEILTDIRNRP